MKIACVCQRGNCRSVGMAYALKDFYGHDAVAIGWRTAGRELRDFVYGWADLIVVMQEHMRAEVPAEHQHKVKVCDVGPDTYGNSHSEKLQWQVRNWIEAEGL